MSAKKMAALVDEVISMIALAEQISRDFNVSDHGTDMAIEFMAECAQSRVDVNFIIPRSSPPPPQRSTR